MQRPFPTPPLGILRHMVLRSRHRLLPLETRTQQGSMVHPMRIRGHGIFASYLTAVNTSLYFVPGILAVGPRRPIRQRGPAGPTPLDICRY
jgi:hypothetical protein